MTKASSISQSVLTLPRGSTRSSLAPAQALEAFWKTIGSLGMAAFVSAAWPR
jgi:hypothetical protein